MPKYQVALDDGRKFMVEADMPPSPDDVYAALGSQQGGGAQRPPPARAEDFTPQTPSAGSLAGTAAKSAWDMLNPVAALGSLYQAVRHPVDTAGSLINAQVDQFSKAKQDYAKGHYSEMLGHGAAGLLPLLGPAAAHAGEAIGTGDPTQMARGVGEAAGLLGSVAAPRVMPGVAERAMAGTQGLLKGGAKRIVSSNLKVSETLRKRNPNVDIPQEVLNGGFKPGSRGFEQASTAVEGLGNKLTSLVQGVGGKFSLQPVLDKLDQLETQYLHSPNGAADLAAVRNARNELMQHQLYSKPVMRQMPDGSWQEVGRKLRDQTAPEIDLMKKNTYAGLKGKYGVEKGPVIETDKAMGRGLKQILDDNVPGAQDVNAVQGRMIATRNALGEMAAREEKKYPIGLMDMVALSGHNPILAPLLLKHPTTAFPIAHGMNRLGTATSAVPMAARAATATAVGNRINTGLRMPTKSEAEARYAAYLESLAQQ